MQKFCLLMGVSVAAMLAAPGSACAQDAPVGAPAASSAGVQTGATPSATGMLGTPATDQIPPSTSGTQEGTDIVVRGFRQSLRTAQEIKQRSNQIVDSIVAEDIGKLPDATASESLARVPGVQVSRGSGEATTVRVRGLPDVTTTFNGRELFTAEGRNVALQDFPAGTIARLDVYKTGSANLIEPGIAGEIDVRSRKPFDIEGSQIAGSLTGLSWRQSKQFGVEGSLLVSKRWQTGLGEIGVLAEGSYTDNDFLDSYRTDSQTIQLRTLAPTGARYPASVSTEYPRANRFRPTASLTVQWRPTPNLELYDDFLWQAFRGRGQSRLLTVGVGADAALSNVKYCDGSTTLVCSLTATGGDPTTGNQAGQWSGTNTFQAGGGFIWTPGNARISGDAAVTDSTFTSTNFLFNFRLNAIPTRNINFTDPVAGGGTVQITDVNLGDPAAFRMTGISENGAQNHGHDVQARLDADVPLGLLILDKVQAGVRFNNRDANTASYSVTANLPATNTTQFFPTLPLQYEPATPGFATDQSTSIRTWATPVRQSLIDQENLLRALVGRPAGFPSRIPNYTANEKAYAAYLQGHYAFDLVGVPIDGQIGLRAVRTSDRVNGTVTTAGVTTPYSRQNHYNDYLPNVSARILVRPNLQARLAFTKTRTRPAFGSLNPTLTIGAATPVCGTDPNSPDCFRTATGGNPDLRPTKSTNYDATLEYYFSGSGSATAGIFERDVDGFINNTTRIVVDPQFGRLSVNSPENGQKGRIKGVELGFRSLLDLAFLPDWARNFGVDTNYTYLDHKAELPVAQAATLPGLQPISGVSKHLANVSGFYENDFFSVRASYNYRSSFRSYGSVTDPALPAGSIQPTLPLTEKGLSTLDLSATMSPAENITLAFNISNLLGNPSRTSRIFNAQGQSYPFQVRYPETIYRFGVRFRF